MLENKSKGYVILIAQCVQAKIKHSESSPKKFLIEASRDELY